jgi:phage gp36-like protein
MYATAQDIIDRYTLDELIIAADFDGDGEYDTVPVNKALSDASEEIDSWLQHCYETPVATPLTGKFSQLTAICVDIACYRLGFNLQKYTEEKDSRYKNALNRLGLLCPKAKQIMSGKVENLENQATAGKATLIGGGRVFSRNSQKGLL